jgi:hypothetical protein
MVCTGTGDKDLKFRRIWEIPRQKKKEGPEGRGLRDLESSLCGELAVLRGIMCIVWIFVFLLPSWELDVSVIFAIQPFHRPCFSTQFPLETVLYCKPMIQNLPTPRSTRLSTLTPFRPYARRERNTPVGHHYSRVATSPSPPSYMQSGRNYRRLFVIDALSVVPCAAICCNTTVTHWGS